MWVLTLQLLCIRTAVVAEVNDTQMNQLSYLYDVEPFTPLWFVLTSITLFNLCATTLLTAMRGQTCLFLTHLFYIDLLMGISGIVADLITQKTAMWSGSPAACKALRSFQGLLTYASVYVIACMMIDRGHRSFCRSLNRTRYLVTAWAFSVVFSLPIPFIYGERTVQGRQQCAVEFSSQWMWQFYTTLMFILLFALPVVIMFACYVITRRANSMVTSFIDRHEERSRNRAEEYTSNISRVNSRDPVPGETIRTEEMPLILVGAFVIC
ncbi:unnamed protein product [Acanthoscelides obtectus]|uniref:G-protein coupled receptors family 1 profile domain-containing protein n=1 Tax=Acanthoscelides obtectus TaxID=200917 RepID=A0A9P0LTW7_ACAOB|nr:unnamed protein product [Acanthoscelides obtectus]CAK1652109.1 Cardioacceleratory peptide receptor [Acanthoscelides obtectus]